MSVEKPFPNQGQIPHISAANDNEAPWPEEHSYADGYDNVLDYQPGDRIEISNQERSPKFQISPENQIRFGKLADNAKSAFLKTYEGLQKFSKESKIVGKCGLMYNAWRTNKSTEIHSDAQARAEKITDQINKTSARRDTLSNIVTNLEQSGGTPEEIEGARQTITALENEIQKHTVERDKFNNTAEKYRQKVAHFSERRDAIADTFVSKYEAKLRPFEENIKNLKEEYSAAEMQMSGLQIRNSEQKQQLDQAKAHREQIISVLQDTGMSEKEIASHASVKSLNTRIDDGLRSIQKSEETMQKRLEGIQAKIAKEDERASKYRTKRDEFLKIKEDNRANAKGNTAESGAANPEAARKVEVSPLIFSYNESPERQKVTSYLAAWNEFVTKDVTGENEKQIDVQDFLRATTLRENTMVDFKDFKKVFAQYFAYKKIQIPDVAFERLMQRFFDEKLNANQEESEDDDDET